MNNVVASNIIRFILLFICQVLIFKRIDLGSSIGGFAFIHIMIYPLFIVLLPIKASRSIVLLLSFLLGVLIDFSYDSPGIHASACVFSAYMRGFVLDFIEPFEGYNTKDSPTLETMGISWFMTFFSIILGLHLLFYFTVEAFLLVYIYEILMNTIFTFIASFIIGMLMMIIFKPKH